ncbi:MAG TPA: HEAT repeat domain-containing protein, partial [Thermoanaerobaculia bacterium]|nr:HEAT repeat domain-containing protein [Thermoanaerobaculia bacterium]
MTAQTAPVRELLLQLEKTLTVRKLYSPHATPYRDAMRSLEAKVWRAIEPDGVTLRVASRALLVDDEVVLERPQTEDAFFFPLYRDGLRELALSPELTHDELETLLGVFEAERQRRLAPDEDLIAYLWRCDLAGVRFSAVDGIGDEEADGEQPDRGRGSEDYAALVADLVEKIHQPGPPETGQTYAFVLDADVRLQASDLRYDATTTRRAFADNPTVFHLTPEQAAALRGEVAREDEAELLERFTDILLAMAIDPERTVEPAAVLRVLQQLVEGLWSRGEHAALGATLERLRQAAEEAAEPAARSALRDLVRGFFSVDRIGQVFRLLHQPDGIDLAAARQLWEVAGDDAWEPLIDLCGEGSEGPLARELRRYLRERLATRPELLRRALGERYAGRALVGLSLLDPRVESVFARELLALAHHPNEAVRLKAVAAVGRLGSHEAGEALWSVMQHDAAQQVRLLAFRLLAAGDRASLVARLSALVAAPDFGGRPLFERRKVGQMVAEAMGEDAAPLFASWIPPRRLFVPHAQLE